MICHRSHTVAIMLPTGRHFFESFYGILLAGGIPVPCIRRSALHSSLIICIARRVSCRMPVRPAHHRSVCATPRPRPPLPGGTLRSVVTVADLAATPGTAPEPVVQPQDALVQYTSGSTGTPKA